jgi:ADP-ribose pyrophosphatase YjhB (NUDIX family)
MAKIVYEGVLHTIYQWDQLMFDGSFSKFEMIKRNPSVSVIAVTDKEEIILIEEEQPFNGTTLTLPGGISESSDLEREIKRELLEETGFESDDFLHFDSIDILNYSKMEWQAHFFIAKNCYKTDKTATLDAGEKITVKLVNFDEFLNIASSVDFGIDYIKNMARDALDSTKAYRILYNIIINQQ